MEGGDAETFLHKRGRSRVIIEEEEIKWMKETNSYKNDKAKKPRIYSACHFCI
jgi:hypothetical protein